MNAGKNKINVLTEALGASIKAFQAEEDRVAESMQCMKRFIVYLQRQDSYIQKYKSVEAGIITFLDSHKFEQKADFDAIKHACDLLPGIDNQVLQVGQMVESLRNRPDRYGLTTCIKDSETLVRYSRENMKPAEADKVSKQFSSLISTLQNVIDCFRKEDEVLNEINLVLKDNNTLLREYPLYEKEIKDFLSAYPHQDNIDMQYVKQHIEDLVSADRWFAQLKEEIDVLSQYADRFDKEQVVSNAAMLFMQGHKNLVYSDLSRVKTVINKARSKIREVRKKFQEEEKSVASLYHALSAKTIDVWLEDAERIGMYIKRQIIDRGACYVDFSLDKLFQERDSSIGRKRYDMQGVMSKYGWLKRERYQPMLHNLYRTDISYNEFIRKINEIKSSRGFFTRIFESIIYM